MTVFIIILAGLILGSFLSVVFSRLEIAKKRRRKKSTWRGIAFGRSRCDHCGKPIAWYDNIPLVSFLTLRGKCRHCGKTISVYHPMLELATALYLVAAYLGFGWSWDFAVAAVFGPFLLLIFSYDLKHQLIPNVFVVPALVLALLWVVVQYGFFWSDSSASLLLGSSDPTDHLLGGLAGGGFFLTLSLLSRGRWIGGGDVKLGLLLGLLLGWPYVIVALIAAYLIGTAYALTLLAAREAELGSMVPFGPMLVLGFFIAEFYGSDIVQWYQGWFL